MPGPAPTFQPTFPSEFVSEAEEVVCQRTAAYRRWQRAMLVLLLHEDPKISNVDAGAAIEAKDGNGRTALMNASSGPFSETVELLLKKGASVNVQGTLEGFTPLMTAAAEGLVDVVRLLLTYGADRNLEDQDGDTALSFAKRNGHTEVVELLEMSPDHD